MVTLWNSLSLGSRGQREIQVPSVGSGEPLSETAKAARDSEQMSAVVAIPGTVLRDHDIGKHCWDLLGALPTSWHYGVVPAGVSHP